MQLSNPFCSWLKVKVVSFDLTRLDKGPEVFWIDFIPGLDLYSGYTGRKSTISQNVI